MTATATIKHEI